MLFRRIGPTLLVFVMFALGACQRDSTSGADAPKNGANSREQQTQQDPAARALEIFKKATIEPYEEIDRQSVGGMEVILGRATRQRLPSTYAVVFAFHSDNVLFHEAEAKGLQRSHAFRLGLKEKVTIVQHFQRPPRLPFLTDLTLSLRMQKIRENADECLQMDAPPDNTIQSVGMVRAKILAFERVGRFSDPQIELQQEPNKRIIRRFVMGEQPIFFHRPLAPSSRPTNATPQKLLMIQGRFLRDAELQGLSDEALGESLHLWVDHDREAPFVRKSFSRKGKSLHFSLHTYNTFPPTDLRRFRVCFFSPTTQRRARRTFFFKGVTLK